MTRSKKTKKQKNFATSIFKFFCFFASSSRRGFTLIELLVGLAIFSIATLIITNVFVSVVRSQRQAVATQKIQSDLRLALEHLNRNIRQGIIDYDYYHGLISNNPQEILVLRDSDNSQIQYRWRQEQTRGILEVCINSICAQAGDWAPLISSEVNITQADFYIWPNKSPFQLDQTGQYLSSQSPLVTIVLTAQALLPYQKTVQTLQLQTSVTSRVYKR